MSTQEITRWSDGSSQWYWPERDRLVRGYASCPECHGTGLVNKSAFTWFAGEKKLEAYQVECNQCRNRFLATQDPREPWREQREQIAKRVTELENVTNHELRLGNRKKLRPGEWEAIENVFFSEQGTEHRKLLREWWGLYPPVVSAPVVVWQA